MIYNSSSRNKTLQVCIVILSIAGIDRFVITVKEPCYAAGTGRGVTCIGAAGNNSLIIADAVSIIGQEEVE
jgi:hypothetical protein